MHPVSPPRRDHSNSRVVVDMPKGRKEKTVSQFCVIDGLIADILPAQPKARSVAVRTCCDSGSTSVVMYARSGDTSNDAAELRTDVH